MASALRIQDQLDHPPRDHLLKQAVNLYEKQIQKRIDKGEVSKDGGMRSIEKAQCT